jgi:hypothetical protein
MVISGYAREEREGAESATHLLHPQLTPFSIHAIQVFDDLGMVNGAGQNRSRISEGCVSDGGECGEWDIGMMEEGDEMRKASGQI